MFFILVVFPFILSTVGPCVASMALHVIFNPVSDVCSSVKPYICAFTRYIIIQPFAGVVGTICPFVLTHPFFFTLVVIALVITAIRPVLHPIPMLNIIFPYTIVACPTLMHILALAICFGELPLAFVVIAIFMLEFPESVCIIIFPVAFVKGTIGPSLLTMTLTLVVLDHSQIG